jgi:Tol biopolymer transport system component
MHTLRVVVVVAVLAGSFATLTDSGRASFPGSPGRLFFTAIERDSGNPSHLYSINSDGSDLEQLTTGAAQDRAPAVSPGGGGVVISRDTHEQCGHVYWGQGIDLFLLRPDGSGLVRLTDNCPLGDFTPAWSPSGRHLVFSRSGSLWSMKTDGTDQAKLTCPLGDSDYFPDWSPDGRTIAFVRDCDELSAGSLDRILAVSVEGMNLRSVTMGPDDVSPSWSPDGRTLVFVRGQALYSVRVDGTHARQVFAPRGHEVYQAAWLRRR